MRIGVVGVGSIANRYHLPSLRALAREHGDLVLAAVCDVDADRASTAAAQYGFEAAYSDYHQLVERAQLDAVWVLVPVALTCQVSGYFLRAGVPTLMEKPPGANLAEARELATIARETGTPNMVAFNRRFTPFLVRMRDQLRARGGADAVSCQFYRTHRDEDVFPFATGLHGLDALCYLADDRVDSIETIVGRRGSRLVTFAFAGGASGRMEMLPQVGVQSERYSGHAGDYTCIADGLTDWLTHYPGFYEGYERGKLVERLENEDSEPPERICGFWGESAAFVEALRAQKALSPTVSDSLRSIEIAWAVQAGESIQF